MTQNELETATLGLLKENGITTPIFREDTRDPNYRGEYIEILPLDFNEQNFLSSSVVNVNVHIPDVNGIKNSKRLNTLSDQIRPIFRQNKDATEQYYTNYKEFQFLIATTKDYKEDNGTHFRNFRIKTTYLNT